MSVEFWVGAAIGAIGIAVSIYTYLRSRQFKRLSCAFASTLLQGRAHPDVSISFRGVEVNNLIRTLVFFWNSARADIRVSDVPHEQWPSLQWPAGTRILSTATLIASNPYSQTKLRAADHELQFTFDYLNPGDGVIAEVLFDASEGSLSPDNFSGPVIGGREPEFAEVSSSVRTDVSLSVLETLGGVLSGVGLTLAYSYRVQSSFAFALCFAVVAAGLGFTISANYFDLRRVHRRFPAFIRAYLKRVGS
jgi:hypothetical protein